MTKKMVLFEGPVSSDWIDYNGHMNDACYVVVFSKSIDELMLRIGLDETFRTQQQVSIYTLQSMVHYLQEVSEGEPLRVEVQLLESDSKKLRVFFTMLHADTGEELAAMESLLLHMDMASHRAAPFLAKTQAQVDEIQRAHANLPFPALSGRSIALRRSASP
ncbi:MAG: thioesterase family protein [Pseudomonadales bacterium]|jgi:acyl-CoA thioester hydrolase